MSLQVVDRLGWADAMTLLNSGIGVLALAAAVLGEVRLVAQLILLAAVADGLDGVIARRFGSTEVGPYLDSMADIVSFGTTPAVFVFVAAREEFGETAWTVSEEPELAAVAGVVAAGFVIFSLVRTALYTVYVGEDETRPGIQNTLASSILAAAYLAGLTNVPVLLGATAVLSVLMIAPVPYPKLRDRDAIVLGALQTAAILRPTVLERVLPRTLLLFALAYLLLGPRFYWGE
jgi:CDP-diacylglycerol--serine O-phosphatidyltransferase